jgi:hypothetical protein
MGTCHILALASQLCTCLQEVQVPSARDKVKRSANNPDVYHRLTTGSTALTNQNRDISTDHGTLSAILKVQRLAYKLPL